ncbi:DMT family transporter [Vaginella massiliensis]|uniref:DMT family transporter n=1 Tax=Vaginella massiliensis TaxID=1816680 RepID=UPI0008396052|nr:DMT family transporter [Vaginella massiliensis]
MISKTQLRLQFLVLLWGFTGIFGKLVTISALPMVWFRMGIAAVAIFLYLKFRRVKIEACKSQLLSFVGIGFIIAFHWFAFYLSIKVSNVSVALSTLSMGALFTSFLEPIFFKRKIDVQEVIIAIIVSVCVMMIFQANPHYVLGIVLGIFTSFLSALFSVLNAKVQQNSDPINITLFEMLGGFACITLMIPIFQPNAIQEIATISWANFGWLALLGIVFTAFAQIEAVDLLKYISPYTIMLNVNLEPIYGIVLAYLIFGDSEQMSPMFYFATLVMILAIIVNGILKHKRRAKRLNK